MTARERAVGAHERHQQAPPVGRAAALWQSLVNWRNWRLAVKLAAVTLVPVIFVMALGAVVIAGQVSDAHRYEAVDSRVSLTTALRDTIAATQQERDTAAVASAPGHGPQDPAATQAHAALDKQVRKLRTMGASTDLDPVATARLQDAEAQLGKVDALRGKAKSDPAGTVTGYTGVIRSLLGLERALAGGGGDRSVTQPAIALYDLDAATEEVYTEQAVVLAGITQGHLTRDAASSLRAAETRRGAKLAEFRSLAGRDQQQQLDAILSGPAVQQHAALLHQAIDSAGNSRSGYSSNSSLDLTTQQWNAASQAVTGRIRQVADGLEGTLRHNSAALQNSASDGAGLASVLLFCAVLVAAAVVWVIARQLLRSIRTVRTAAQDVATRRLPEAVADIQQGRQVGQAIDPVGVDTAEEVGQLARAFDAVHLEARKLAVEQAGMRASYGNVFVNISRRSQSLVQRQLRLLERLERDEEDSEQLSTLFQLDHLATRMRRNNENLMVLSGSEPAGKGPAQQPAPVGDLLRAAVSEIEHYERVSVQLPPSALVLGYAAGDLVRLVAELLDNATAFSAPDTQVTVGTGQSAGGKLVIDIVDHGIGMLEQDLAEANERLAAGRDAAEPAARQMGMFVIGRLAERHGITVRLQSGKDIPGVRASVVVPPELVVGSGESAAPERPSPTATEPALPRAAEPFGVPAELPKRTNGARRAPEMPRSRDVLDTEANGGREPAPAGDRGEETAEAAAAVPDAGPDWSRQLAGWPQAASSSAATLFTPSVPDGEQPDAWGAQALPPEHTPIFDQMISAWFDPNAAVPPSTPAPDTPAQGSPWSFAADAGMHAAQEMSQQQAETRTPTGLPKRTPRARLLPGSAGPAEEDQQPGWPRDAERVRDRLASLDRGLREGRAQEGAPVTGQDAETGGQTRAGEPAATGFGQNGAGVPAASGQHPSGLPQRGAPRSGGYGEDAARRWAPEQTQQERQPRRSAADDGFAAAAQVADAEPEERTQSGLPKRAPRERLLPGNAGPAEPSEQPAWPRDAESLRDRLASLDRGLREGRSQEGAAPAPRQDAAPAGHEATSGQHSSGLPQRGAARTGAGQAGHGGRAGAEPQQDPQRWRFAADDGFAAAAQVAGAEPEERTQAGLPKRTPRARLLPGSAGQADPEGGSAAFERNPERVRSRFSSLQRGVQNGRESTGVPSGERHEPY